MYTSTAIDLPTKAGSIAIYDSRIIHKAKVSFDQNFVRKTIFFQIDTPDSRREFERCGTRNCEPVYLNAAYIDPSNFDFEFFSCGLTHSFSPPITSAKTIHK